MPCGPTPPPRLQLKNWVKNHSNIDQNGSQIDPRGSQRGSWEYLGRPLGGSGGQLGPKMVSRPQKWKFWPPLGGHLGSQNRSKIDFRVILKVIFFIYFYGLIFDTIWSQHEVILGQLEANLRPTWINLRPTWDQLEPTWGQLEPTRSHLKHTASNLKNSEKPFVFKTIFTFRQLQLASKIDL